MAVILGDGPAGQKIRVGSVDSQIRALLDSHDLDAVENSFMERLEEKPGDIGFYLPVIKALVRRKESGRAETLLQLLVDNLRGNERRDLEVEVYRAVLQFWPQHVGARRGLQERMEQEYGSSPNFERLAAHCNVADDPDALKALECLERWLSYDEGRGVYMAKQGVGRVTEINPALETLRVTFQGKTKAESFRLGEAQRLLELLPEGHFLLQKLENPQSLQELAKKDPGEVLRGLFESLGRTIDTTELRELMDGLVPSGKWSTWWNKAREDSRLTVGSGSRPVCTWSDSGEQADSGILGQFAVASPEEKLELVRKYASRSSGLAKAMADGIAVVAREAADKKPALALQASLALDKLPPAEEEYPTPKDILEQGPADDLIAAVDDRGLRRQAVSIVPECREDWQRIYLELLRTESDSSLIKIMYEALKEGEGAEALERLIQTIVAEPDTAPRLYVWMCREMPRRPELHKHIGWTFLRRLLVALNSEDFKGQLATLRKFFDPGGIVDEAVRTLGAEEAKQLLAALDRTTSLEDYRKDQLRDYVLECCPQLREDKRDTFLVTPDVLQKRRDEFERLVKVDIPHNTQELRKAKEHGDLSENFEYKAARNRQEMLSSRAKTLSDELTRARTLDPKTVDTKAITVGTRVRLEPVDGEGEPLILSVLGPWDSDPNKGIFSYMAPMVEALLGAQVGEQVTFHDKTFTVGSIGVWNEKIE